MALKKVEHNAPKKQVMTLDELAAFVEDARRSGATGSEAVAGGITWGGKINRLSVEVDTQAADRAFVDKDPRP